MGGTFGVGRVNAADRRNRAGTSVARANFTDKGTTSRDAKPPHWPGMFAWNTFRNTIRTRRFPTATRSACNRQPSDVTTKSPGASAAASTRSVGPKRRIARRCSMTASFNVTSVVMTRVPQSRLPHQAMWDATSRSAPRTRGGHGAGPGAHRAALTYGTCKAARAPRDSADTQPRAGRPSSRVSRPVFHRCSTTTSMPGPVPQMAGGPEHDRGRGIREGARVPHLVCALSLVV